MTNKTDDVVVSTVTGEKFTKFYERLFKDSQTKYVSKIGLNFVYITDVIEVSKRHKHISWQKMLMFRHPDISPYKRVLFIDADVYVTRHARNPFESMGNLLIAETDNNPYNVSYFRENDPMLYEHCPKEKRPKMMLNGGVLVVSKEANDVLEKVFYGYDEQPCYDNGPMSYHILNHPRGGVLPTEFNVIVAAYQMAFGRGLSSIITMYKESSFLHFAGGPTKTMPTLQIIKYVDTHPTSLLTNLIFFFGKKKYDFMTAPVLNGIKKVITVTDYHIKRRFKLGDYKK